MTSALSHAREYVIQHAATVMQHVAGQFHLSQAVPFIHGVQMEKGVQQAGIHMVEELVEVFRQSDASASNYFEISVQQLRSKYGQHFESQMFRQSVKYFARLWVIDEVFAHDLTDASTMYSLLEYFLNELMSPVDLEGGAPVFVESGIPEELLQSIYRRLPQLVGLSDHVDRETDRNISRMLSAPLISPNWYKDLDVETGMDEDTALKLYDTISDQFRALRRPQEIHFDDGLLTTVLLTEYTGMAMAAAEFRCLVATTTHRGAIGIDFYIAVSSSAYSGSGLLVGDPGSPEGESVVYQIYAAYAEAIKKETGTVIDIDQLIEDLEDENEF